MYQHEVWPKVREWTAIKKACLAYFIPESGEVLTHDHHMFNRVDDMLTDQNGYDGVPGC